MESESLSASERSGQQQTPHGDSEGTERGQPVPDEQAELRRLREEVDVVQKVLQAALRLNISSDLPPVDFEAFFDEIRSRDAGDRAEIADRILSSAQWPTVHDLWARISELGQTLDQLAIEFHSAASFGLLAVIPSATIPRYLPVSIYLSQESLLGYDQGVRFATIISRISEAAGFTRLHTIEARYGSFFSRWISKSKEFLSQPEVEARLHRVELAVELEILHKRQAQVDQMLASAVSDLLRASESQPNVILRVGSVLFMKRTDERGVARVGVRTLTAEQVAELDRNADLLSSPHELWQLVAPEVTAETVTMVPDVLGEPVSEGTET